MSSNSQVENLSMNHEPIQETGGEGGTNEADGSFIELDRASKPRDLGSDNEKYTTIVTHEPNQEFTPFLETFLEGVRKNNDGTANGTLPEGVRLNDSIIHLPSSRTYRKGFEFEETGETLGTGICGPVRVVKDTMNGKEHALKTVPLSEFKENEIRCWIAQNNAGYVPKLYMFQVQNGLVLLHMEKLKYVMTLESLITFKPTIISKRPSLWKLLALHVHWLLLAVMKRFHETGWMHNDLLAGNVLLKVSSIESLKVYILDFGFAEQSDEVENDMKDIAFIFAAMLEVWDRPLYARTIFGDEGKNELDALIKQCDSLQDIDISSYIRLVGSIREKAINETIGASVKTLSNDETVDPFPWPCGGLPSPPTSIIENSPPETIEKTPSPAWNRTLDSQIKERINTEEILNILEAALNIELQTIEADRETDSLSTGPLAFIHADSTSVSDIQREEHRQTTTRGSQETR